MRNFLSEGSMQGLSQQCSPPILFLMTKHPGGAGLEPSHPHCYPMMFWFLPFSPCGTGDPESIVPFSHMLIGIPFLYLHAQMVPPWTPSHVSQALSTSLLAGRTRTSSSSGTSSLGTPLSCSQGSPVGGAVHVEVCSHICACVQYRHVCGVI